MRSKNLVTIGRLDIISTCGNVDCGFVETVSSSKTGTGTP